MIDFLVESMQTLCVVGLLCGAYYSITYDRGRVPDRPRASPLAAHPGDVTIHTTPHARV
jgi:hypothetical protein